MLKISFNVAAASIEAFAKELAPKIKEFQGVSDFQYQVDLGDLLGTGLVSVGEVDNETASTHVADSGVSVGVSADHPKKKQTRRVIPGMTTWTALHGELVRLGRKKFDGEEAARILVKFGYRASGARSAIERGEKAGLWDLVHRDCYSVNYPPEKNEPAPKPNMEDSTGPSDAVELSPVRNGGLLAGIDS